ncbi:MAG: hypothetical protein OXS30_12865 [Chloroflexota bacterium]|nr:hypothetical protein [Chloroflexota bacterium]
MTAIIDRTFTEARRDEGQGKVVLETGQLKDLRSASAYVLLGDPGLGKSTAFESECLALREEAVLIDARDFLAADLESRGEWRTKTLFIDGLDEVRVGSADARSALDEIRRRLDALRRPRFRISCRQADWLGDNDRDRLECVSPDSTVRVVRLDPLSDADIERVLEAHLSVGDPEAFIAAANRQGIGALLANPQTLTMLAEVVGGGERWPKSRRDTFEMASLMMAREVNEEHSIAGSQPPVERLLDAAGFLCAVQLITSAAGFRIHSHQTDSDCIALGDLDSDQRVLLHAALSSRLFRGTTKDRIEPVHRHVGEFLAARFLAQRIKDGLPVRRVLSLISGFDAIVVSSMKGLSGWLAAFSSQARQLLIERDPIGVALYGDLYDYTRVEKSRLLKTLGSREVLLPLRRVTDFSELSASLSSIATSEMEPAITEALLDPARDEDQQGMVQFVLNILGHGAPLPNLRTMLLSIVRDESRWPWVRSTALDASIAMTSSASRPQDLVDLLEDICAGAVTDWKGQLRGILLTSLYPRHLPAACLWDYLEDRVGQRFVGREIMFWRRYLLEQSSDDDVAILLDSLASRVAEIQSVLSSHLVDQLPVHLLARALKTHGDDVSLDRLCSWLRSAVIRVRTGVSLGDDAHAFVREWLEGHPEVQKAVILHTLEAHYNQGRTYRLNMDLRGLIHGSQLPPDFAVWCLEQSVRLAPQMRSASEFLFDQAFQSNRNGAIPIDELRDRIAGVTVLEERLAASLKPDPQTDWQRIDDEQRAMREAKHEEERREGIEYVRGNADALRKNQAPLSLLHNLGQIYFEHPVSEHPAEEPLVRITEALGADTDLVEAAISGLVGSVWRDDLPDLDEIVRLSQQSRIHFLALPVQAGVEILYRNDPTLVLKLSQTQIQTVLGFYYCTPGGFLHNPAWHADWIALRPEVVANAATKTALSAIRHKDSTSMALDAVIQLDSCPRLKHDALLEILAGFPPRASLQELRTLDILLRNALDHDDRSALLDVIESKLSRKSLGVAQGVHWLAAGLIAAPSEYTERVAQYVGGHQRCARHLASFFDRFDVLPGSDLETHIPSLQLLIELVGSSFAPDEPDTAGASGFKALERRVPPMVMQLIQRLASLPDLEARLALQSLHSNTDLVPWQGRLAQACIEQRIVHREATYAHPDLQECLRSLNNQEPANAGDLAALVLDRLEELGRAIRTSNANGWRQYWNEDSHGRPERPKPEDSCRDALLSHLRNQMPQGVDCQPEGQYAGNSRSDIRVSAGGCNVPVEIKKISHRDLWSALRDQLIAKYARDPDASGYGIYLVFWFDGVDMAAAPVGKRPRTPGELQARLEESLTAEEALKVSVFVLDVSPGV